MIKLWSSGLLIAISVLLLACSSKQVMDETAMYQQYPSVKLLKDQLATAKDQELDLFSPNAFTSASKQYSSAIKLASQGDYEGEKKAQDGLEQLSLATNNAEYTRYILEEVLGARKKAIDAGASTREAAKFETTEKELLKLSTLIETGNVEKAKAGRAEVLRSYGNLELLALKGGTIEEASIALTKAKKNDVDALSPKTFKLAENELKLAQNVLDANRSDVDKAEAHAKKSQWYTQQANQIAEIAKHFDSSDYSEEDKILWYQNQIARLVSPVTTDIAFNLPNREVIKSLNADLQSLVDNKASLMSQLQSASANNQLLVEENKKLIVDNEDLIDSNVSLLSDLEATSAGKRKLAEESEKAMLLSSLELKKNAEMTSKFNFVQSLFKTSEADIYRLSDDVLIRAHGFYFPLGKSEIESNNFALLNKITEAVNQFPDSKVIVSGHTDSTGSDDLNMRLSQERAEKVAKFLNQVGRIEESRIEVHGFGKQKPVLSNETVEGRSANRRVEILIVNSATPSAS